MASLSEVSERLLKRFKGVPNYGIDDATFAVEDALATIGYTAADDVPIDKVSRLLLLAQSESAYSIAFSVAHYFSWSDGEESINKSMVSDKYLALAKDLRERYDNDVKRDSSPNKSSFHIATRIDRPDYNPYPRPYWWRS